MWKPTVRLGLLAGLAVAVQMLVVAQAYRGKETPAVVAPMAKLESLGVVAVAQVAQVQVLLEIVAAQVDQVLMMVLALLEPVVVVVVAPFPAAGLVVLEEGVLEAQLLVRAQTVMVAAAADVRAVALPLAVVAVLLLLDTQ